MLVPPTNKHSHGNTDVYVVQQGQLNLHTRIKQYLSSQASPSWSRPPQKTQHMKHKCFTAKLPLSSHDIGLVSRNAQPKISISSQTQHKLTIMWYFIDLRGWILFFHGLCLHDVDDRVQRQLQSGVGAAGEDSDTLQPSRCLQTHRGRNLHHPAEEWSPGPLHSTCCPPPPENDIQEKAVCSSRKENRVKSIPSL